MQGSRNRAPAAPGNSQTALLAFCPPSRHFDHQLQARVERVAVRLDNAVEVTLGHGRLLTISVRGPKCRVRCSNPVGSDVKMANDGS
jgi:hypothetical protein